MKLTRRSALSLLVAAPTAFRAFAASQAPGTRVFLGTFTAPTGTTPGAKGIYTSTWDASSGRLGEPELAVVTPDPSFLARSAKLPDRLFAVNEMHGREGTVTAFAVSADGARLKKLNAMSTGSEGPCHLALDDTAQALFVADYAGGTLSSYRVTPTGLSDVVSFFHFSGHSIVPDRQATPHTHCVRVSPDNRFLVVNDLGLDRIMVFHIDPATAKLTPARTPFVSVAPGSGPRHSLFHTHKPWVYSVNELNSTIDMFDWNAAEGVLTHKARISSLPAEARGQKNAPAELTMDSSGRFLYVSNRSHDSIGVFLIDQKDGTLSPIQDIACGGKTPRHFTLDPSERWVLVANQDSRNIAVFERNRMTGKLTATGRSYVLDSPVCILFA